MSIPPPPPLGLIKRTTPTGCIPPPPPLGLVKRTTPTGCIPPPPPTQRQRQHLTEFQSWLQYNITEKETMKVLCSGMQAAERGKKPKEAIIAGEVPFGFSASYLWPNIVQDILKVKENMTRSSVREQELKIRIQELRAELARCEEEYSSIQQSSITWEKVKDPCEKVITLAKSYQETEEILSRQVEQELKDPESLSGESLALVFNAVGLSSNFIKSAAGTTGEEFLHYDFLGSCNGLSENDRLEARYCMHMLENRKIPYKNHVDDDCPICDCDTSQALVELVEEYQWPLRNEVIKKRDINGRKFLMMSVKELVTYFSIPVDEAREIWKQKKKIHYDSLRRVPVTAFKNYLGNYSTS